MSGTIIDRRGQALMTFFVSLSVFTSTLLITWLSTNAALFWPPRIRAAAHLRAARRTQLDGVHRGAHRDVAQRQVVAHLDVRGRTVLDDRALPQVRRGEDVALLAVDVVQQRDPRGAVRVVLDLGDLGRHAVLVVPLEVDQPVRPLVPPAVVASGDLAGVVPAALLGQRTQQRLLGSRTGE